MDAEKDDAAPFKRFPTLDRDLPEIFVESQEHAAIRLCDIKECRIAGAGQVRPRPGHIVTGLP